MCKDRGLYIKTGNQRELDGVRLDLLKNYFGGSFAYLQDTMWYFDLYIL